MTLHNFIRDNAENDSHFESDVQDTPADGSQFSIGDSSTLGDDCDIGALRDAIAAAMMS